VRFEYLILLIVAFNVITALVKRRAARKAREAVGREGRAERDASSVPRASGDTDGTDEVGRVPGLGRDILDQIARDLGLKLPKPASPESRPRPANSDNSTRPATPANSERPAPVIVARREAPRPMPESSVERRAAERRSVENRQAEAAYATPATEAARSASPAKDPKRSPVTGVAPARKTPTSTPVARVDLRDPAKLREAFVLKEILGAPVSRGRRGSVP
jgi:hypothetical protein